MLIFSKSFQFRQMRNHTIRTRALVAFTLSIDDIVHRCDSDAATTQQNGYGHAQGYAGLSANDAYIYVFVACICRLSLYYLYHCYTTTKWCGGTPLREVVSTTTMIETVYHNTR